MKKGIIIALLHVVFFISVYAQNVRGKVDITFGNYDQIRNEYTVIRNYMPGTTLYWLWGSPGLISFDDDMDGNYYMAVSVFGIKLGESRYNYFKWVNGKPYCIVKMRESPISKNYIEVTLPIVYYADNTVIIYDQIDSITKNIDGANAIRIILFGNVDKQYL
jgi:hypothetical protein